MHKDKLLLSIINNRLSKKEILDKYNIPYYETINKKLCYIKYLILEVWDKKDISKNLIDIFGIYAWIKIYLLLIKGI